MSSITKFQNSPSYEGDKKRKQRVTSKKYRNDLGVTGNEKYFKLRCREILVSSSGSKYTSIAKTYYNKCKFINDE